MTTAQASVSQSRMCPEQGSVSGSSLKPWISETINAYNLCRRMSRRREIKGAILRIVVRADQCPQFRRFDFWIAWHIMPHSGRTWPPVTCWISVTQCTSPSVETMRSLGPLNGFIPVHVVRCRYAKPYVNFWSTHVWDQGGTEIGLEI